MGQCNLWEAHIRCDLMLWPFVGDQPGKTLAWRLGDRRGKHRTLLREWAGRVRLFLFLVSFSHTAFAGCVPPDIRRQLDQENLRLCILHLSVPLLLSVSCAQFFPVRMAKLFGSGDIAQGVAERIGKIYKSSTFGRLVPLHQWFFALLSVVAWCVCVFKYCVGFQDWCLLWGGSISCTDTQRRQSHSEMPHQLCWHSSQDAGWRWKLHLLCSSVALDQSQRHGDCTHRWRPWMGLWWQ